MGIRVSAGTAYVKGFDVDHVGSTIIDVPKPRDTKPLTTASIPFAVGSLIRVNNVYGTPYINIGTPASGGATNTNLSISIIREETILAMQELAMLVMEILLVKQEYIGLV